MCVCVCVCVFSSHLFWASSSLDVPGGVTREESHTGFLIHLPSAARALIFLARRIQSSFSLVDREVEFCVHQRLNRFPLVGHFFFFFLVRKIPFTGVRTHVPTCQKVTRLLLSYRGDRPDWKNENIAIGRYSQQQRQRQLNICSPEAQPWQSRVCDRRIKGSLFRN